MILIRTNTQLYTLETRVEISNARQMFEANEIEVLRLIVGRKIDRIRSQQMRESCNIQPNNEWVERRREWDEHLTRMDAERLVKISKGNIQVRRRSPGRPTRRWSNLIPD